MPCSSAFAVGARQSRALGFTLIEMMIVVAIIAILSAIAYPSYMESVRKSNRADAKSTLMDMAQQMERCMSIYGGYDNASCPFANGASVSSKQNFYTVAVSVPDSTSYSLTATASHAPQTSDSDCGSFTLNSVGAKTAKNSGGSTVTNCW